MTEVVRQAKDSYIISLATELRERIKSKEFINIKSIFDKYNEIEFFSSKEQFLSDFYKDKNFIDNNNIIASFTNATVKKFNKKVRDRYWHYKGIEYPKEFLEGDYILFKEPYTHNNDRIIFYNSQIVSLEDAKLHIHADIGIKYWECKAYDKDGNLSKFNIVADGYLFRYKKTLDILAKKAKSIKNFYHRKEAWRKFYHIKESFADVQYIFASTIHKLQGSTYDEVYIDLNSIIYNSNISIEVKYRLAYVAVTRASKDLKIYLQNNFSSYDNESISKIFDEVAKIL